MGQGPMRGVAPHQILPGSPFTGSGLTRTLIQTTIPSTAMTMRPLMMSLSVGCAMCISAIIGNVILCNFI